MGKRRKNIYKHKIDLSPLKIRNKPRKQLVKELEAIAYRGYEVEDIEDGRKIVITKPGGKFTYGKIRREDFMVWVYNPGDQTLWLIKHDDIYEDIELKGQEDPNAAIRIINALERVYAGEEPEEVIPATSAPNLPGESCEVLLKAYKWIWGQEDVNYPEGLGRRMSFEGKEIKDGVEADTGKGLVDLREQLQGRVRE